MSNVAENEFARMSNDELRQHIIDQAAWLGIELVAVSRSRNGTKH